MSMIAPPPSVCEDADTRRVWPQRAAGLVRPVTAVLASASARKGMFSVADQAVVSVTSFLTTVIVARATSREALGVYYLALTLVLVARGLQSQMVSAPYLVYCHRHQGSELAAYTGSSLVHQLLLSLLVVVGLLGLSAALSLGLGPPELSGAVWAILAVTPVLLLREFGRNHSLSHLKPGLAIVQDVANGVLQLGALLLFWHVGRSSVAETYAVMGGAAAAVSLLWFYLERGQWHVVRARILPDWRHNWSFARWAVASHLIGCASLFIMPWVVAAAHGQGSVGMLGVCGTLAGVANLFVMGLANYIGPYAARTYAQRGKRAVCVLLAKAMAVFAAVVGGICLLSLVIGEELVVLVYGSGYAGGGPVLSVCLLGILAISVGTVAGNGLWAIDRPKANFLPDVCSLLVALVAAALLVGPFDALGAALATLAGAIVAGAMKCLRLVRLVRLLPEDPLSSPDVSGP